jgi:glycosyltransferase involved in cell wall biosynthesis
MTNKTSIIVTTFNRRNFLPICLQTLSNQLLKPEVIVVNDAGDNVQDVVDQFNDQLDIKYVEHTENKGLGAARNTGLRLATGNYVGFLDDDDGLYPYHTHMLASVLNTVDAPVAYSDAVRITQIRKDDAYLVQNKDIPYSIDFNPEMLLVQNITPVTAVMVNREKTGEIRFDETLNVYEDWDLWIRLSLAHTFFHTATPTCYYTWRTDGTSMSSSRPAFRDLIPEIYSRYRDNASDLVKKAQNNLLNSRSLPIFID